MRSPKSFIEKIIAPNIQKMKAYHVADSGPLVKLDAMENSYPLSEALNNSLQQALAKAPINRYPESHSSDLQAAFLAELAPYYNKEKFAECDVLFGNGSDELIQLLMQAVDKEAGPIMSPSPSFSMYQVFAQIIGKEFCPISLDAEFAIDMAKATEEIADNKPSLIFISYPNNPTGNLFNKDDVLRIIEMTDALVVIDQAYTAFSSEKFDAEFLHYPNVVLLKTLSKVGFAGIRFGYLYGHKEWINEINKIRPPYNVNVLTQAVVAFYLDNKEVFIAQAEKIRQSRDWLMQQLAAMNSVHALPSETNFITFKVQDKSAADVFALLKSEGVLIKNLHQDNTPLANFLRVTVGTQEECQIFVNALKNSV